MAHPTNQECHAFTVEICRGDRDAHVFCDLWFNYCHGIDDLIDTMEDGRPTMKPEAVLSLFANAAALYNCPFFVRYRDQLLSVALLVTSAYADSVAWERSPIKRRRIIADVLRCCGDEMFFIVAMLTGGWAHVRSVSSRIRERDWILQHDEDDNPN